MSNIKFRVRNEKGQNLPLSMALTPSERQWMVANVLAFEK